METTFIHITTNDVDSLLSAARVDGELLTVNFWSDPESLDRAFADPDINRVQDETLLPMASVSPTIRRMTVVQDLRIAAPAEVSA